MGQNLPGSSHDARGNRPPRPSRHDPRNECRQLSPERSCRQSTRSRTTANARDNQELILIVAPRQSNQALRNIACVIVAPRQSSTHRDRRNGHPDCRWLLIQIVALHAGDVRPRERLSTAVQDGGTPHPAFGTVLSEWWPIYA